MVIRGISRAGQEKVLSLELRGLPAKPTDSAVADPEAARAVGRAVAQVVKPLKDFNLYQIIRDERAGPRLDYALDDPNTRPSLIWKQLQTAQAKHPGRNLALPYAAALMIASARKDPASLFVKDLALKLMRHGMRPASCDYLYENCDTGFVQRAVINKLAEIEQNISAADKLNAYEEFYERSNKSQSAKETLLLLYSQAHPEPEKLSEKALTLANDLITNHSNPRISYEVLARISDDQLAEAYTHAFNKHLLADVVWPDQIQFRTIVFNELEKNDVSRFDKLCSVLARQALANGDSKTFSAISYFAARSGRVPEQIIRPEDFLAGVHQALTNDNYGLLYTGVDADHPSRVDAYYSEHIGKLEAVTTESDLESVVSLMIEKQAPIASILLPYLPMESIVAGFNRACTPVTVPIDRQQDRALHTALARIIVTSGFDSRVKSECVANYIGAGYGPTHAKTLGFIKSDEMDLNSLMSAFEGVLSPVSGQGSYHPAVAGILCTRLEQAERTDDLRRIGAKFGDRSNERRLFNEAAARLS